MTALPSVELTPRADSEAFVRDLTERFDNGGVELPVLSESVQRVIQATSAEDGDARTVADLIKRDQAFAGHLLRIASSPMYAAKSPVASLQQAVSRLGMRQVREVAIMISMETRVFAVKGFSDELKALFRHAIATALFAQEVARSRRTNVEEAFLAGLLHDVGKPVVLQAIMDSKSRHADAARADKAAVWKIVDQLHAQIGERLAAAWKLPETLARTIANHHDASSTSSSVHVARLADDLAHFAMGDETIDEARMRNHPMALALNFYPEDFETILQKGEQIAALAGASS